MAAKVDTRYWRFCACMGPLFVATFYVLKAITRIEQENAAA